MSRRQPPRRIAVGQPVRDVDPATVSLERLFDEFIAAKRRKHSQATVNDYSFAFKLFGRWLTESGRPSTLASFDENNLEAYADHLGSREALPGCRPFDRSTLSRHSQSAYLRPLNTFGGWLEWAGWVEVNPFLLPYESLLPDLSESTRIIKLAREEDVRALFDQTAGDDPLALRDRAILLLGWWTGCRCQDIVRLDLDDLNLHTGELLIRVSKGDRDRVVILGGPALHAVARYLGTGRPVQLAGIRPGRRGPLSRALFVSDAAGTTRNPGGRLTPGAILQMLTQRWNDSGRDGSFGPHRLRHGLATMLSEANVSLSLISRWLGQSLESTTALYAHPTPHAIARHVAPIITASLGEAIQGAPV